MGAKTIIGRLLLAFVLVSVGFAVGQEVQRRRQANGPARDAGQADLGSKDSTTVGQAGAGQGQAASAPAVSGDSVMVYYFHASYRCLTCNLVESTARKLVETNFADAIQTGRLQWRTANFQEDEDLAQRYSVGANMLVVVRLRDGKEVAHRRLDRVMELIHRNDEFADYVLAGVQDILEGGS
jgi:hypothetical protein